MQVLYPGDRLLPFASVDGITMSGWIKKDAIYHLNKLSKNQTIAVFVGETSKPHSKVKSSDIGLAVAHNVRIKDSNYPWYLRIIPSSLFWFGPLQAEKQPTYTRNVQTAKKYLTNKIGASCAIPPKDSTLKLQGNELIVVAAVDGGTCRQDAAVTALTKVKPQLDKPAKVKIPVIVSKPKVSDAAAKKLVNALNREIGEGVTISVADSNQVIVKKEVLSWLVFSSNEDNLSFSIAPEKATTYFAKNITPKITKPAGVTKVTTVDFTETSRANGANGQTLGLSATLGSINNVLSGQLKTATVSTEVVAPKVEYSRSYTKTNLGINALLQHYAEDHPGKFGVSFSELGGRGLNASYNTNQSFITASTYKLFVAYSVLKRIESGEWKWSDEVTGGRNVTTCFDDMIVKSDNACAEAMYKKVGYQKVIDEARALGLSNTKLASDGQRTTPGDLTTFLAKLENNTTGLNAESRSKLIEAMKRNTYRLGVPAGASGATADKVGFLNGLLHDAAIVYSPKGTYVLAIMTDGSSWGNIADLTRKIESLR